MWSRCSSRVHVGRLRKEVRDHPCAEAGEDKVSKVEFNIMRLVCPLVVVWLWVEELYIRMYDEEYAAIYAILLFKAVGWGEGSRPGACCDMCFCLLNDVKVGKFCSVGGRFVVV